MKVSAGTTLAVATALLISTVAIAERWLQGGWEIPGVLFFGAPLAAFILVFLALRQIHQRRRIDGRRNVAVYVGLALALAVTIASVNLGRARYLGDHGPARDRLAPDGAEVTSVTWSEQGGRYIETLNGRFQTELTESQYREIMRKHQAPFIVGLLMSTSLALSLAVLNFVLAGRLGVRPN